MKTFTRVLFFLLIIFTSNNIVFSQIETPTENIDYFEDGGIDKAKNIFKFNFVPVIYGEYSVSYERIFFSSYGLEIGAGLVSSNFNLNLGFLGDTDYSIGLKNGRSFLVNLKYYIFNRAPIGAYLGLQGRKWRLNYKSGDFFNLYDIIGNVGVQVHAKSRLFFDFNHGIGYKFEQIKNDIDITGLSMTISIKLGIYL